MTFVFSQFVKYPNLKYGFSARKDGSMHRHFEKGNRERYFQKIGIDSARVVTSDLVHGAGVVIVSDEEAGTMVADTDGLITNTKNLFLSATGADCFILYLYDPEKNAIGITHAGWRGLLAGIVKNATNAMVLNFGTVPQKLLVGIGPGIRQCHFEISRENKNKYEKYPELVLERDGKCFVDLPGIIKLHFREGGVKDWHIEDSNVCTYCDENEYFSYRRDKPKEVEPMVGHIGLV